jgi:hypothetical protein
MIRIVAAFGAPVIEAAGKRAVKISTREASVVAVTSLVIWNIGGYFSIEQTEGH